MYAPTAYIHEVMNLCWGFSLSLSLSDWLDLDAPSGTASVRACRSCDTETTVDVQLSTSGQEYWYYVEMSGGVIEASY